MGYAAVFPGQGSQEKGMGGGLFSRFPRMVEAAGDILGYSIRDLCLHDPDDRLRSTQYAQPALFTVNALAWEAARENGEELPAFVAGHSLGEYNALTASGVLDFATGLRLVKKRGELMNRTENGGMAAVIGPGPDEIRDCLAAAGVCGVYIANLNTPAQTVVSGTREGIGAAKQLFGAMAGARFKVLNVSGAFHSPLMEGAAAEFSAYLAGFELLAPKIPVVSNVLARPYSGGADGMRELLCRQIISPVRWMESIRYMAENGAQRFQETGPGRVLGNMVTPILGAGR
ncbi:MAG: ACP S-malonyltransferase [Desulfobacter sp.]|nr:MAG: ACP S-malonyltransferase [Desulfobacter sp.]